MFSWNNTAWFAVFTGAALKSTAVLAAAWFSVFLLRRHSAATRHLVWTSALAAVVALPFLLVSLPALRFPAPDALLPAGATDVMFRASASTSSDAGGLQSVRRPDAANSFGSGPWSPDWKVTLMLLWVAGAGVLFIRMLTAGTAIRRIRRSAKPFFDRDLCGALSQALGIRQPVDVLETKTGSMPMACGLLRSAILMPADAVHWSEERRRIVLLHELAHVRRGDLATQLLARMALTLYWWNPLAWTAWHEFLKERERAADDLVLSTGARASEYASHLLEVARSLQCSHAVAWVAAPMARRSQLEGRLRAILDSGANRKQPGRLSALVAVLLAGGIVAPLAAVRAQAPDGQDRQTQAILADVDTAIRSAESQKNYEILESAAKTAERTRKYDAAQKLLEAAVAMRAQIAGQESMEYGVGLLGLADLEKTQHHSRAAEAFYARAAQILGDRPEAARALMYLGTAAILNKDFAQAFNYFQRAERVEPALAGRVRMWSAVMRQRELNFDQAEMLYKNALSVQDPKSPDAATTMKLYAELLRVLGRADEANELGKRADAVQRATAGQVNSMRTSAHSVHRVGGDVSAPSVLQKVDPEYTEEARAAMLSGTVVMSLEVGPDGLAQNARVSRGLGLGLDENAIDAISQWRFRPGIKDGQPVTVAATIEVNFRLL
ncbi:MAG: TonB family protein [Bryobacterales bacterium]|nr:TonB family protein [Bryobacterales bacterium]